MVGGGAMLFSVTRTTLRAALLDPFLLLTGGVRGLTTRHGQKKAANILQQRILAAEMLGPIPSYRFDASKHEEHY